jgi:hypothetical protein
MMEILLAQSAQANVKRMKSHPSGLTLVSTGLRRHVGNKLVEPGALPFRSRPSTCKKPYRRRSYI